MSWMVRFTTLTCAILFFCNIAVAQFLPEDQIPLEIQNQIIADVITEHGHLDMAALEAAFREWLLSQPLPDADGQILDAGTCSDCSPPTDGEDLQFPSVRDVQIITREGRIRPSFKVKWRRPVRLPREIRDLYELDSYEVFLTRDDGVFEHHVISKELRADGTERLPRRIRFRRRDPGVYTVHVRPVYVEVEQTETASNGPAAGSALAGSTGKTSGPITRGGLSGGTGPWGGGGPAILSPDSSVDEIFEVATGNTNPELYNCIVNTPGYDGSTEVGLITTLDCSDHNPAITSIAELEYFSGLTALDLENNNVNDLTGLSGPEDLQSLNLSNNDSIPVNGSFGIVGFELLASLDSITHLYLNNLPLKAIPGLNNTANYITVSLRNNDLASTVILPACPTAPPTGDSERVQIVFMDISDNGLQDEGTRHIAPYIIGSLVAENNQFENIKPSNCDTLARVSNLHISGNIFPGNNLGPSFDLSSYEFDWFSMRNTNVGQLTRRLPEVCASIDLSSNAAALLLSGATQDLPNAAPYQLDLSGSTGLQCTDIDELTDWYSANVGGGCALPLELPFSLDVPSSCSPSAPEGLTVSLQNLNETQAIYQATWQPAPAHWGVTHYRIDYGTSQFTPESELLSASVNGQAILELDSPGNGQFHFFKIRSCTSASSSDCSAASAVAVTAEYPLLAPRDFDATVFGATTTLSWSYPAVPPGGPQRDYVISPVFAVTGAPDEIITSDTSYLLFNSSIAEYPGGAIQVAACWDVSNERECGPQARLSVLPPPDVDPTIAIPANLNLSGNINQHQLTWDAVPDDRVDYYLVEDRVAQTEYAVEETDIDLRRYRYQDGTLDFSVRACQRNRDTGDICSDQNVVSASGINPSYNLGTPVNLCFFEDDEPSTNLYYLRWEYNSSNNNLPDDFDIDDVGISGLPTFDQSGQVGFDQAEYDEGMWYWVSPALESRANDSGDDYFSIHARINPGHAGTAINISPRVFDSTTQQEEWNESVRCAQAPPVPPENPVRTIGGPGDLNPGHWGQDPERKGNGWRFYWASELRYDDDRDAYRITYDLIGFWYTYRWLTDASGNNGQWSPVWYFSRMILNDRDPTEGAFYQGELIYPRKNAADENVGSVQVYFTSESIENVPLPCGQGTCPPSDDNQNIWIDIHLDHDDGMASNFGHQLNDTAISHPDIYNNPVNRHDHYSGVWTEGELFDQNGEILTLANNDFFLVEWIEKELHSMGLNFFDSAGDPVWSISTVCENGVGSSSCQGVSPFSYDAWQRRDNDFGIIFPGNNPTGEVPPSWGEVSDHRQFISGAAGRVYRDTVAGNETLDLRQGKFCADLNTIQFGHRFASLETGGSCSNVNDATVVIDKVASIHDIRFSIGEDEQSTDCEISDGNPSCGILLDWSTEDYFPSSEPFYRKDSSALMHLSNLCNAAQAPQVFGGDPDFVVADYPCDINQPGTYEFVLFSRTELDGANGIVTTTDGAAIAFSRQLSVSCAQGQCPDNVGVSEVPDAALTADNVHTLSYTSSQHNAEIGAVAGQAGVSGGAASYSIPINIPPGRQGMQPSVGLSYNSRAGNGTLGMGWSLSAGSSISRCPSTVAQDGISKGVTYNDTDRLCLDGQRLVKTGGNGLLDDYWASGSQYSTELDSFVRVTLNGNNADTGGCTASFTIDGKDNIKRTYGSGTAKVQPVDAIGGQLCVASNWLVAEERDRAGNFVEYRYVGYGDGEQLLDRIVYTGFATTAGNREVRFAYAARSASDRAESFLSGYRSQQTQLLDTVKTYVGTELVRQYDLQYGQSQASSRSLLVSVEECAFTSPTESDCLPETLFEWQSETLSLDRERLPETTQEPEVLAALRAQRGEALPDEYFVEYRPLADLNGDGATDFAVAASVPQHIQDYREANNLDPLPNISSIVALNAEGDLVDSFDIGSGTVGGCDFPVFFDLATFADMTGDGITDLGMTVKVSENNYRFRMYSWDNPDEVCPLVQIPGIDIAFDRLFGGQINDFNNDGLNDIYRIEITGNPGDEMAIHQIVWNTGTSQAPHFELNTAGTTVVGTFPYAFSFEERVIANEEFRDFNGDGLLDIFIRILGGNVTPSDYRIYLNQQQANGTHLFIRSDLFDSNGPWGFDFEHERPERTTSYWIDINGDGLDDFVYVGDTNDDEDFTWHYKLNQGGRFAATVDMGVRYGGSNVCDQVLTTCEYPHSPRFGGAFQVADLNANGVPELLLPDLSNGLDQAYFINYCAYYHLNPQTDPNPVIPMEGGPIIGFLCSQANPNGNNGSGNGINGNTFINRGRGASDRGILAGLAYEFRLNPGTGKYELVQMATNSSEPLLLQTRQRRIPLVLDAFGDGLSDIGMDLQATFDEDGAYDWINQHSNDHQTQVLASFYETNDEYGLYVQRNLGAVDAGTDPQVRHIIPDLMIKITDGLMNQSAWNYAPLSANPDRQETQVPLYMIPDRSDGDSYLENGAGDHIYFASSMYVVSQFDQSNGINCVDALGAANCDADWVDLANTTYYGYEEAVYNTLGRGFQGFRKIISEQHVTGPMDEADNNLRSVSWFHQIFPLAGRVEASYTQRANVSYNYQDDRNGAAFDPSVAHLNMTLTNWACQLEATPQAPLAGCAIGTVNDAAFNATGIYQPIVTSSVQPNRETDQIAPAFATTTSSSSYDNYGNVLVQTQTVDNTGYLTHTSTVTNTYASPDLNGWWLNQMQSSVTTASSTYTSAHTPPTGLTGNSRTTTNLYAYNSEGMNLRRPTCQQVVDGNAASQSCGAASGVWQQTSTDYDQYGNVVNIIVDASDPNSTSIVDRVTHTTYSTGTDLGYFPKTITNALDHMVTTTIESREGNPTMVTDANGLVTNMAYDPFGRETETWHPIGGASMIDIANHYAPRSRTLYADVGSMQCPQAPDNADYCMLSITDGAPIVRRYFDSLNRVVEVQGNAFKQNSSQQQIVASSVYNARGQMILETVPKFDSVSMDVTTYEYDALGRATMKSQPSSLSPSAQMVTHYQYDGLTTTVQVNNSPMPPTTCSQTNNTALDGDLCMQRTYASNGWLLSTTDAHGSVMGYWYDGQGNPVLIQDPMLNHTTAIYNNLGHRTQMNDPNMGLWSYSYNGLGEVLTQNDANQQFTTFSYDQLGRLTQRIGIPEDDELGGITDTWEYDDPGLNGLLISETRTQGFSDGVPTTFEADTYMKTYAYDSYQRPTGYSVRINPHTYGTGGNTPIYALAPVYTMSSEYDQYFGRVKSMTYPQQGLREYTVYEVNGYVQRQGNSNDYDSGGFWRRVDSMSPINQVVMESFGNGADQMYHYNPRTFQMEGTDIGLGNGNHNHDYTHDLYGNLITQQQIAPSTPTVTETYGYDHLMRLISSDRDLNGVNGAEILYEYDRLGNITEKGDYGSDYDYGTAHAVNNCTNINNNPGPNAATRVDLANGNGLQARYGYDGNGNLICGQTTNTNGDALSIHYDHTNKPFRINRAGKIAEFWYGSADQRYLQQDTVTGDSTIYIGGVYEQKGNTQKLYLGNYAVMTIDPSPGQTGMAYLHKDRLGSVIVMSDDSSNEISQTRRGFDPFGKPREAGWENSNGTDETTLLEGDLNGYAKTTRGYTGHEHLNGTDLIHMNGRAYDYNLGRFLSVDPIIQAPGNSQSLNPYSYIMNNPMSGTDPSGYMSEGPDQQTNLGMIPTQDVQNLGISADGAITVNLKNGDSYGITSHTANISQGGGNLTVTFTNGQSGTSSQLSFGGFNPEAVGGQAENASVDSQTISYQQQGDSVSENLFPDPITNNAGLLASKDKPKSDPIGNDYDSRIPKDGFDNPHDAVKVAMQIANEKPGNNIEYGGGIYQQNGKWFITEPVGTGNATTFDADVGRPRGSRFFAIYHLHPAATDNDLFSSDDVDQSLELNVRSFIGIIEDKSIREFMPHVSETKKYKRSGSLLGKDIVSEGFEICSDCF